MGKSPIPLWREGVVDPALPKRPFAGTWRDLFIMVDRALASRGISVADTRDAEIWEVAGMIGAGEPETDEDAPDGMVWDELASLADGFDRTLLE